MIIKLLREAGHEEALLGMSLSYYDHAEPLDQWWDEMKRLRAAKRAKALAHRQGGHNKFLESIQVWLFVQASRGWWQEFDTYRAGVTKQSASTMHTLDKRGVTVGDFEENTVYEAVSVFNEVLAAYKSTESPFYKDITALKQNLPEGWLQERVVCTNYKALQNIYWQRHNHRLKHWQVFCSELLAQLEHPEYIKEEK